MFRVESWELSAPIGIKSMFDVPILSFTTTLIDKRQLFFYNWENSSIVSYKFESIYILMTSLDSFAQQYLSIHSVSIKCENIILRLFNEYYIYECIFRLIIS